MFVQEPISNYVEETYKSLAQESVGKNYYVEDSKKIGSTFILTIVIPSIIPNKMIKYFPTLYSDKIFPYLKNSGFISGGINFAYLIIGFDNISGNVNVYMFFAADNRILSVVIWPQYLMIEGKKVLLDCYIRYIKIDFICKSRK